MPKTKSTEVVTITPKEPTVINPESLISQAIKQNIPVETMEKLLAMRRELKEEASKEAYFRALSAFQRECPVIIKDQVVKVKGVERYRFAPLDKIIQQVEPFLEKNGFSYHIETKQEEVHVTAICVSHHVDGHSERTSFTIPVDPDAFMNAAQKVASALTYSKRYSFCNAFGIMTSDTDDDAQELTDDELAGQQRYEKKQAEEPKPAVPVEDTPEQLNKKRNDIMYADIKKMKDRGALKMEEIQKAVKSYADSDRPDPTWSQLTDGEKFQTHEYLMAIAKTRIGFTDMPENKGEQNAG